MGVRYGAFLQIEIPEIIQSREINDCPICRKENPTSEYGTYSKYCSKHGVPTETMIINRSVRSIDDVFSHIKPWNAFYLGWFDRDNYIYIYCNDSESSQWLDHKSDIVVLDEQIAQALLAENINEFYDKVFATFKAKVIFGAIGDGANDCHHDMY